jgi:hypothetical protein
MASLSPSDNWPVCFLEQIEENAELVRVQLSDRTASTRNVVFRGNCNGQQCIVEEIQPLFQFQDLSRRTRDKNIERGRAGEEESMVLR